MRFRADAKGPVPARSPVPVGGRLHEGVAKVRCDLGQDREEAIEAAVVGARDQSERGRPTCCGQLLRVGGRNRLVAEPVQDEHRRLDPRDGVQRREVVEAVADRALDRP